MMIYKNEKFGDTKHYVVIEGVWGVSEVVEYANGCERTRLSMNDDQAVSFVKMLEDNGWKCNEQ